MQTQQNKHSGSSSPEGGSLPARLRYALSRLAAGLRGEGEAAARRAALFRAIRGGAVGLFALLIASSKLALATCPLGIAFLSAATDFVPFILGGCVLGALLSGAHAPVYIIAYAGIFLLRLAVSRFLAMPNEDGETRAPRARRTAGWRLEIPKRLAAPDTLFREKIYLRMTVGCAAGFGIGIWRIVAGGFLYYDLFGALLLIVLCPFLVFLYAGVFERRDTRTPYFEAGVATLLFSLVTVTRGMTLATLSCDVMLAFLLTLLTSKLGNGLRGGIVGLLCGIAVEPLAAPMLGLVGLLSALLWRYSIGVALSVSVAVGVLFGVYAEGVTALVRLLPELAISSALMLLLLRTGALRRVELFSAPAPDTLPAELPELSAGSSTARVAALSASLSSLSEVFYNLSDRMRRPGIDELRRMCDESCERHCKKCSMQGVCWDREYSATSDMLNKISEQLYARGRASSAALPEYMLRRCFRLDSIIEDANRSAARLLCDTVRNNPAEIFALDYEALSGLLEAALAESESDAAFEAGLSDRLREALRRSEFSAELIGVYGRRRHYVVASGINLPRTRIRTHTLHTIAQNVLGEPLSEPEFSLSDGSVRLKMQSRRRYAVEHASATRARDGSELSGDSHTVLDTREDYCYALIADGMGSGREAALTSRLALLILTKMLSAGNRRGAALGLLTAFLRSSRDECSSTVDLCEIDLLRGNAVFLKCGAAPSFVRRDGKLFKLESKTFPVGILDDCDAEELSFKLEEGDVIVMQSDGVAQSFEEATWLLEMLDGEWVDELPAMAEKIAEAAVREGRGRDDVTVTLLRLKAAEEE